MDADAFSRSVELLQGCLAAFRQRVDAVDSPTSWDGLLRQLQTAVEELSHAGSWLANGDAHMAQQIAELQAASQAKDQFLAVLSHELRTPLTPALLGLDDLQSQKNLPPDLHATIAMIRRNINLQARLVDDLLDVTRITHGKLQLNKTWVDAHEVLRQSVEVCQDQITAKNLQIALDLRAGHCFLEADAARLEQVCWNLLKNAVKFTPPGGLITIRTRNEGPTGQSHREPVGCGAKAGLQNDVSCSVAGQEAQLSLYGEPQTGDADPLPALIIAFSDDGLGIDPNILPRLFNAYEQGGKSTTRRFGGLGLGLMIARAIIEAHGGRLTAESAGKDRGSTFKVHLSPARAKRSSPPAATAGNAQNPLFSQCILLVEDHEDTARIMAKLLTTMGHKVQLCDGVAAALRYARSEPFDLIISDLTLPDGNGLDMMRRLRAECQTPAIAITGLGTEEDIRRSHAAGFTEHLTKPIDFQKLEAVLEHTVTKKNKKNTN